MSSTALLSRYLFVTRVVLLLSLWSLTLLVESYGSIEMPIRNLAFNNTSWFSITIIFHALILNISFSPSFSWYFSIWVKTNVRFKLWTESETSIAEMSIAHLLLNKDLLSCNSWIVHLINLSTSRSTLIASSKRPSSSCTVMNVVFFTNSTALSLRVCGLLSWDTPFVPHEVSQVVIVKELVRCSLPIIDHYRWLRGSSCFS